jgi:hypothetical protein
MVKATRGGGRKGDRRVYFESPLADYGALKQRQAIRHGALIWLLQTRMGKQVSLDGLRSLRATRSPPLGLESRNGPKHTHKRETGAAASHYCLSSLGPIVMCRV